MNNLPSGVVVYCEDNSCSVPMQCLKFEDNKDFLHYMNNRVRERLYDIEGRNELNDYIDSIPSTDFSSETLKEFLSNDINLESWRVGETIAECLLEDSQDILFPWNGSRDMKVKDASPPGADLIGFKGTNADVKFLFGEVKTSGDHNSPPNVMYGRSGMTHQLEELKTGNLRRKRLVNWFFWRAKGSKWEKDYQIALSAYLSDSENIYLEGVLIRDTSPDINDLRSRGIALANGKPNKMSIHLCAIYCPDSISEFPNLVGG